MSNKLLPTQFERAVISFSGENWKAYQKLLKQFFDIRAKLIGIKFQFDQNDYETSIILRKPDNIILGEEEVRLFNHALANFRESIDITLTKSDDEGDMKKVAQGMDIPPYFESMIINGETISEPVIHEQLGKLDSDQIFKIKNGKNVNGQPRVTLKFCEAYSYTDSDQFLTEDQKDLLRNFVVNLRQKGYIVSFS